ncbi:MAG: hypothetical protein EHM13_07020, partial [Acidobacteria bacterium]
MSPASSQNASRRASNRWQPGAALAGIVVAGLALFAQAPQEPQKQEIGTLDKAKADRAHPAKQIYSPYAGRNF